MNTVTVLGIKPGLRTTELAVTVLTDVGCVAAAVSGNLSPHWAAVAASVSSVAYSISRGIAKTATPVPVISSTTTTDTSTVAQHVSTPAVILPETPAAAA